MVTISCSGKLHAFALAEQLENANLLDKLFTSYAWQKNTFLRKFVNRKDLEELPPYKIYTNSFIAVPMKLFPKHAYIWNDLFDRWVAFKIRKSKSKVFIGWSGMSLRAIKVARLKGMITILERGSSHIEYQNEILKEEYARFGKNFSIDRRVIRKELEEYKIADYISIPSQFVKKSFIEKGVPENKLILNSYGSAAIFNSKETVERKNIKFIILYLGSITIQKGLIYFFEALRKLSMDNSKYEIWFIGSVADEMRTTIKKYQASNWIWKGQIPQHELPDMIRQCDVAVQPSLQEGMSMVIPQILACGVPVIATVNSGGEDILIESITGYIVPIRDPESIGGMIEELYHDPEKLLEMKNAASNSVKNGFTWQDYGNRYSKLIDKLLDNI